MNGSIGGINISFFVSFNEKGQGKVNEKGQKCVIPTDISIYYYLKTNDDITTKDLKLIQFDTSHFQPFYFVEKELNMTNLLAFLTEVANMSVLITHINCNIENLPIRAAYNATSMPIENDLQSLKSMIENKLESKVILYQLNMIF